MAESDGKIILYDLGKIFSFVRGKRDVSNNFGRNVVGNPRVPEILRMHVTHLELKLRSKRECDGGAFTRDIDLMRGILLCIYRPLPTIIPA